MDVLEVVSKDLSLNAGTDVINANFIKVQNGVQGVEDSITLLNDARGAPNGLATLDASGKLPTSQLSGGGITYLGAWDASTNTPTLSSGSGSRPGEYYIVSVGGSTTLDGISSWSQGEWVIYSGAEWQKIGGSVSSVNGKSGSVVIVPEDISVSGFASPNLGGALTELSRTSHNHALSSLSDVDSSSVQDGVVLKYNSSTSKWEGSLNAGGGDMLASVYDLNSDGVVDKAEALSSGTNSLSYSDVNSHINSTSNPHSVTAAQVGSGTAQWNANKLSGYAVSFTGAPATNQVLAWDGSRFTAATLSSSSGGDMAKSVYDTDNDGAVDLANALYDDDAGSETSAATINQHLSSTDNPHSVTAAQLGAVETSTKGVANGVASLDGSGKVPVAQLPSAAGGTPDSLVTSVTKTSHGFSVGDVIASGNVLADATTNSEVIGIVSGVTSTDVFQLTTQGYVSGLSGLVSGTTYFLSNTPGAMETFPAAINKPILIADSTGSGYFVNFRGIESAGGGEGSSQTTIETISGTGGSSVLLKLKDNVVHRVTLGQSADLSIVPNSTLPSDVMQRSTILLNRQGNTVTFSGVDYVEPNIVTSGEPGLIQNLGVELWREDGVQRSHLWQYGSYYTDIALPSSGLTSLYRLQVDANDSVGSNNLDLRNGASIISSGENGLKASVNQYAYVNNTIINANNNFTIFVAFKWDGTTPSADATILSLGRSDAPDPYVQFYLYQTSSLLRFINKNDANAAGVSAQVPISSMPTGVQLWKLQRNGDVASIECLTNSSSASGTFVSSSDYTMNQVGLGAHVKGSTPQNFWNGAETNPIYAAAFYSRAVTNVDEVAQVKEWFKQTRALSAI